MEAGGKEISFRDDEGIRWVVVPVPAGRVLGAGPVGLEFTSEDGERRRASGHPPRGVVWRRVDEPTWRALLRQATLVT
jgi:hypothetical protein